MSFVDISSVQQYNNNSTRKGQETSWPELINFWKTQDVVTEKEKEAIAAGGGGRFRRSTLSGENNASPPQQTKSGGGSNSSVGSASYPPTFSGYLYQSEENTTNVLKDNETKAGYRGFPSNGVREEQNTLNDNFDLDGLSRKITRTSSETIRRNSADKLTTYSPHPLFACFKEKKKLFLAGLLISATMKQNSTLCCLPKRHAMKGASKIVTERRFKKRFKRPSYPL